MLLLGPGAALVVAGGRGFERAAADPETRDSESFAVLRRLVTIQTWADVQVLPLVALAADPPEERALARSLLVLSVVWVQFDRGAESLFVTSPRPRFPNDSFPIGK